MSTKTKQKTEQKFSEQDYSTFCLRTKNKKNKKSSGIKNIIQILSAFILRFLLIKLELINVITLKGD